MAAWLLPWRIVFLGGLAVMFVSILRMPRRDIPKRFEVLEFLPIDDSFRDLPVWNVFRWSFLMVILAMSLFLLLLPWS